MDKKSRLLIVEDEAIVARDIEDVLKRLGYDVCCSVSSGEEAVEKARSSLPDLILMDIFLKGEKDGIQATEEIQSQYEIPVVYLTSYADSLTLERAKCTAPYGYLLKPFQERDLKSAVEIALCKSRSEKILREKERVFSAILFSLAEGVITADPQGNVLFLNDFAEKLLQIPFEKAKGKRLSSLFTLKRVCEGGEEEVRLLECVAGGRADFNDLLLVSSEGAKHCVDGTLTPLSGEAGFVCVLRNIEERKKAQEELQKTMEFFRLLA
ncbi:MAG TPA: response regulator, partial [Candidatus Aminicenantes bacterium]|nr:response regulator [Candidatus Aminicenantes bacterium]